jgi:Lrp/AsnC family transcriptional regulator for asnA, asnC and gidA
MQELIAKNARLIPLGGMSIIRTRRALPARNEAQCVLDDLDRALIAELQTDGRASLSYLASRLGVTHTTVRNRLERLLSEKIINIVAVVDPAKIGFATQVYIGITADLRKLESIQAKLVRLEEVNFVSSMTGRLDFLVGALFRSNTQLHDFLVHRLSSIGGLLRTETSHVLHLAKRPWQWRIPRD